MFLVLRKLQQCNSGDDHRISRSRNSERAVFGPHGFVSKTLRQCYDLIKNLTSINQRLMQILGPAMHESALVGESVDGEAERRVRTSRGPTLPTSEEDNALSR